MMIEERKTAILTGAILLAGVIAATVGGEEGAPDGKDPRGHRVRVARLEAPEDVPTLRYPGTVRSRDRADLSFGVGGRIARRPVRIGHRLEAGDLVASLDPEELQNRLANRRSRLEEAEARLSQLLREEARVEELLVARAATEEEAEKIRAAVEAARAARNGARAAVDDVHRLLRDAVIRAPFPGRITDLFAETGERVPAGTTVARLHGDGVAEVEIGVPESAVGRIERGAPVSVRLPLLGVEVAGSVESVGRAATGAGALYPVVVVLENDEHLPRGAAAEVTFSGSAVDSDLLTAPLEAIVGPAGRGTALFRVRHGRAERLRVDVVSLLGERVLLRGELEVGDEVVVAGQAGLTRNERVEVIR